MQTTISSILANLYVRRGNKTSLHLLSFAELNPAINKQTNKISKVEILRSVEIGWGSGAGAEQTESTCQASPGALYVVCPLELTQRRFCGKETGDDKDKQKVMGLGQVHSEPLWKTVFLRSVWLKTKEAQTSHEPCFPQRLRPSNSTRLSSVF